MRRRYWLVPVFVVGLALHNLAMSLLYGAGVRGHALTAIEAWKELLLGGALAWYAVRAARQRRLPFRWNRVDWLALAFAAVVLLYALIPQSALGGHSDLSGVAHGVRHHLLFVGAYFLGRCLGPLTGPVGWWILGAAAAVAAFGLVEEYTVSLDWWRHSGARGWFQQQLGFDYKGLTGLPENFVYNLGNDRIVRRLVSTFLSPLATAYMLCVAVLLAAAWQRRRALPLAAVAFVGLLFTYSRSTWLALLAGLAVLAAVQRRRLPLLLGVAAIACFAGFAAAFPHIAPEAHFTKAEKKFQQAHGSGQPDGVSVASDASTRSHWRNLVDGLETVGDQPWGYGVGNSGSTAARFGAPLKAGESTYTELGVDTGVVGMALFAAFNLALLWRLRYRSAWLVASLAAVLVLAVQTDVLGVPWLAICLWLAAGAEAGILERSRIYPTRPR
jgi:O-Antigen ligase